MTGPLRESSRADQGGAAASDTPSLLSRSGPPTSVAPREELGAAPAPPLDLPDPHAGDDLAYLDYWENRL